MTLVDAAGSEASPPATPALAYGRLIGGGVGRSVSWLLAARVVSIATSVLTASILARLLSPADFGAQAIIGIALLLAAALSDGTFAVPLMQRAEIDPPMVASAVWLSILGGLACMGLLMAATPWIGRAAHAPRVGLPMLLTALVLPLRGLSSVGVAMLERNRDYRAISMASMAGNIVYAVVAIAMAVAGYGLWALVTPTLAQVVAESLLNTARARLPLRTAPTRRGAAALFHAGAATTVSQILNWAGLNAPSLITSNLLGAYVLGLYARATNLQNNALQLSGGPVGRVLIPTFASLQGYPDKLRDTFKRFLGAVLPLNTLVTMVAVVHAEAIVRLLLGRKWFAAIPIVQLLFLGFLPRSAYKITEALTLGAGRFKGSASRQAIYFVAVCVGAVIGGHFGVQALALGVALGLWVFYGFSLSLAESLSGAGWGWIGRAHLQALMLAVAVGAPDAAVVYGLKALHHPSHPASFKALILILGAHSAGGLVGLAVLAIIVARSGAAFGPGVVQLRERSVAMGARLRRRLRPLRARR